MKIGLITRHATSNYGSLLQTYASIKLIEDLNCECEIINYIRNDERKKEITKSLLERNKNWNATPLRRLAFKIIQGPNYRKSFVKFENYRNKLVGGFLTKELHTTEDLKKLNNRYDLICAGSDQIWGNVGKVDFDENYFLSWVDNGKRCFSLSSSFGKTELSVKLKDRIPKLFNKFEFVTVRERSASNILKKYNIQSKTLLDPTMLIKKNIWTSLKNDSGKNEEYIFVYQLHNDSNLEKYIK